MIHIAICDDDARICQELRRMVEERQEDCSVICFSSGEELLGSGVEADLIFLDIEMPGVDGMAVAGQLQRQSMALVVFVTAHEERVFDAFDVGAFHYLVKPLNPERLSRVLGRANEEIRRRRHQEPLQIREKGEHRAVYPQEIRYVESNGRKLQIHTAQGTLECYGRMQELERQLGEDFFRCHRGYLVHLKYVAGYDNANIRLKDGGNVYLARQKYGAFVKAYMDYLRKRLGDP